MFWNGIVSALLNAYVYWNVSDTRFNNLHISIKMFSYVNFWVYICNGDPWQYSSVTCLYGYSEECLNQKNEDK